MKFFFNKFHKIMYISSNNLCSSVINQAVNDN